MRISFAGFGLLVGCVTQENYWPRYAAAHCDIIKECGQQGIHETYDSMAQCRRSYRESYADLTPCYADCDFDADKAAVLGVAQVAHVRPRALRLSRDTFACL